jgi:predicted transposase YbfD/YdcC
MRLLSELLEFRLSNKKQPSNAELKKSYITGNISDAHKIGSSIPQHWGIENSVHWRLDVTFGDHECQICSLYTPQNFALVRPIALNALERESSFRLRQKSRRAAINDQYVLSALSAALPKLTFSENPTVNRV